MFSAVAKTLRGALKVMPPILCWLTTSEKYVSVMAVEVGPSHQYPFTFCCCMKMETEVKCNRMLSDMEEHT